MKIETKNWSGPARKVRPRASGGYLSVGNALRDSMSSSGQAPHTEEAGTWSESAWRVGSVPLGELRGEDLSRPRNIEETTGPLRIRFRRPLIVHSTKSASRMLNLAPSGSISIWATSIHHESRGFCFESLLAKSPKSRLMSMFSHADHSLRFHIRKASMSQQMKELELTAGLAYGIWT